MSVIEAPVSRATRSIKAHFVSIPDLEELLDVVQAAAAACEATGGAPETRQDGTP